MAMVFTPYSDHSKTQHVIGDLMLLVGTLDVSGTYPTGGEDVDLASLFRQTGVGEVLIILGHQQAEWAFSYDSAEDNVLVHAEGAELVGAAYPAGLVDTSVPVAVLGR